MRPASAPSRTSTVSSTISPVVMVPVLSRHTTLTRASVSTEGSSCTNTCWRASETAAVRNASVESSTRPSGTSPTIPAAELTVASRHPSLPNTWNCDHTCIGTTTMSTREIHLRRRSMEARTSDADFWNCRASAAMRCTYASGPTVSATNLPAPAVTMVPDITWSSTDFGMESASPVRFDWLISSECDSTTGPSAGTWSPAVSSTRSPCTTADTGTSTAAPSRMTRAVGACMRASLSSLRFAVYSWMMPTSELMTSTPPNNASPNEPATSTTTNNTPRMALNLLITFARTMSISERDEESSTAFVLPEAVRSATSPAVRPRATSIPLNGSDPRDPQPVNAPVATGW